jgi:tellurite resistance protein
MKTFAGRPIPLGSFASVMGITGLGLAWRDATEALHVPAEIGEWLIAAGAIVFVLLLVAWIARTAANPAEIQTEEHVATTESYFGMITISCSLLAAGAVPYSRVVATILWIVAAFGGAGLIIYLQGSWIARGIKDSELTPSLFIPIVGNATAVYAAVPLGYMQLGWASFAFAIVGWLVYAPMILYRLLVTEPRLPRKLAPQLALLL